MEQSKIKMLLHYHMNKNGATSGILPDSSTAYAQNNRVITVSQPGNLYDRRDPNSWQELKKSGYDFLDGIQQLMEQEQLINQVKQLH